MESFGNVSEQLLIQHGKRVIEKQFVLNRLADSAIDIYTSAVALSRASNSLTKGLPSADHEQRLASVWVSQVTISFKSQTLSD